MQQTKTFYSIIERLKQVFPEGIILLARIKTMKGQSKIRYPKLRKIKRIRMFYTIKIVFIQPTWSYLKIFETDQRQRIEQKKLYPIG